jgi:formamidopyrimidine-DNA glycosylase
MPELPEVETVRRGLSPVLEGARIARLTLNREGLRFPFPTRFRQRVEGRRIVSLSRRAKYLVAELDSGEALIMHLGMSGRFLIVPAGETAREETAEFHHEAGRLPQHDHVVFVTEAGDVIIYNDARRFGFMDLAPMAELASCRHFSAMGIEPLGNELSGETLARLFAGKSAPLKAALLDQRLIAGLGNIYVCEALFRARLHPEAPAGSIAGKDGAPRPAAARLAAIIREVLAEAVEAGGSTLRDFQHADGSLGYFQHSFRVYGREGGPCVSEGCGSEVARIVQSGRSTFFCPSCQRMGRAFPSPLAGEGG